MRQIITIHCTDLFERFYFISFLRTFCGVACIELIISALLFNELVMGAALNDTPLFQYHDAIGITHGRQSMGNYKCGAAFHQCIHTALYQTFGTGIDGGCGFVQNQYRRVGHGYASNGQQLSLPLRKVAAVAGKQRIVAIRQFADKFISIGQFGCSNAFFIGGIQSAITNIFHHCAGK